MAWGTLSGLFWGTLIGLLLLLPLAPLVGVTGGLMGAALGAAENLGISVNSGKELMIWCSPAHQRSSLSCATPDKFLEALRPYGGTVLQTSLPHEAEQQLMRALHGDDRTAATWESSAAA